MENVEKIIELYKELKSIWKVGEKLGISGQKVNYILNNNGIDTSKKPEFTELQIKELIEIYKKMEVGDGTLESYCNKHNKSKPNVCRKAKRLGLTNESRKHCKDSKKNMSNKMKCIILNNGHPKGMLGKKHTIENKIKFSKQFSEMWKNPKSKVNSEEHKQLLSDRFSYMQTTGKIKGGYSRGKQGWYLINGKEIYFRSLWEANYALYLDFLIKNNMIKSWSFEKKVFWFEKIKRGVRSYKPDFEVIENNGEVVYHEVKGYMDSKSKTKINRMRIYHPNVKLIIIDKPIYNNILSKLKGIVNFI